MITFPVVTRLEMSDEEAVELRTALDVHLHELRTELAATEAREYRADLRKRLDRLERITARLSSSPDAIQR
jgi:hypothetical protein